MKMTIMGVMVVFEVPLLLLGELILWPLEPFPKFELLTIMVICPVLINSLMFWVTDHFLKYHEDNPPVLGKMLGKGYTEIG